MTQVLIVPTSATPTVQALGAEASRRGLSVVPVSSHDDLAAVAATGSVHFFGGPVLGAQVQRLVPLALLEPTDDWLPGVPERFVRRSVRLLTALDAYGLDGRHFVKMPREKDLEPGAYHGHELPSLPADEPLLVSDLVTMTDEWRFWILDGRVHASSSYRRNGYADARPLAGAERGLRAFVDDLLADQAARLPSAVVVDVAWISDPDPGWAVVEANMAWFSSHYAADPALVLDVVLRAAGPRAAVRDRDLAFCDR